MIWGAMVSDGAPAVVPAPRISLAVLGDSDSQGFQDIYDPAIPASEVPRGGAYHATTFQWTEVLDRLRGQQLDLGDWGVHGMRGRVASMLESLRLVRAAEQFGFEVRAPRKRDHRFNFAYSGDQCGDLFGGWSRQAPRLVRLMDSDPSRWARGIVVIKIGGNDFGNNFPDLDRLAHDPASSEVRQKMDFCLEEVRRAVTLIHQHHPDVRIVLGGVFDNAHWARFRDKWRSPQMLASISKGLDYYDDGLQRLAGEDKRFAFFSDRLWFRAIWGSRGNDGAPNYRTLVLSPAVQVTNTGGDAPSNASVADGHAGLVWNSKWAQALVDLMNSRFGLQVPPITDDELLSFIMSTGAFKESK